MRLWKVKYTSGTVHCTCCQSYRDGGLLPVFIDSLRLCMYVYFTYNYSAINTPCPSSFSLSSPSITHHTHHSLHHHTPDSAPYGSKAPCSCRAQVTLYGNGISYHVNDQIEIYQVGERGYGKGTMYVQQQQREMTNEVVEMEIEKEEEGETICNSSSRSSKKERKEEIQMNDQSPNKPRKPKARSNGSFEYVGTNDR